jgi:hypothetical protein
MDFKKYNVRMWTDIWITQNVVVEWLTLLLRI